MQQEASNLQLPELSQNVTIVQSPIKVRDYS